MRRLLEEFDRLFDLDHEIEGVPLGALLEEAITRLDNNVLPDWATPGDVARIAEESKDAVRFRYFPHLYPEMDLKLRLAHMLQFHLLPRDLPAGSAIRVSAVLESYCHLSGDLFGWEPLPDGRFLLWIVDMSGHGVRSGLASAILKVIIATVTERSDPAALVPRLNEALCACTRRDGTPVYATGQFLWVTDGGHIQYTAAGHPPAMVRGGDGRVREIRSNSMPIGMFPGAEYAVDETRIAPGDLLVLATDGLFEMESEAGTPFGSDGLRTFLESRPFQRTTAVTEALYGFSGEYQDLDKLDDDLSFVAARLA